MKNLNALVLKGWKFTPLYLAVSLQRLKQKPSLLCYKTDKIRNKMTSDQT